jgi:beta-barrel assembly-enhancing protease
MKRKSLLLFLSVIISIIAFGQDFNNYIPMKSSGKVPEDLRKTSYQKYTEDLKKLEYGGSSFEWEAKKKFLLQSRFYNDLILHSGRILFNDPMTEYINKVAAVLLKDDEELLNKVRFYTLKSTVANAYCMDNGVILITTGLLAQLENESQLAYIIGHEITHYVKKHAINQFLEEKKMEKGKDSYNDFSYNEKIIASLYYSKEDEFEADKESVNKYIANSKYSVKALESVFDVLQFSYLPFDDVAFDTTFFNTRYWSMPSGYWMGETKKVVVKEEDEDDLTSTHPNIKRRRMMMDDYIKKIPDDNRQVYVVSESEFKRIQKIARYELSKLYLLDLNYGSAIYNSFLLLKENPESHYLKSTVAYALYGISKYKNGKNITTVVRAPGKIEGKSQALFHMLRKIKGEELNILAINYIWKLYVQYPNDPLLQMISKDIVKEMVFKYKTSLDDFSTIAPKTESATKDTVVAETSNKKYDKIRKDKKKVKETTTYMLVEVLDNNQLKLAFDESFDDFKSKKYNDNNEEEFTADQIKAQKRKDKYLASHGYSLGIDTIIALDPFFTEWNLTKKESERLIGGENKKMKLTSQMKENAANVNLSLQMLDSKQITEDDADLVNDMGTLHDWINETLDREDLEMINCNYNELKEVCARYNTHYLYFNGMRTIKYRDNDYLWYVAYTLCCFPILTPYYVYKAIAPSYLTQYYGILFDVDANKTLKTRVTSTDIKYKNDIVNSILYDEFNQIKRRDKSQIKK